MSVEDLRAREHRGRKASQQSRAPALASIDGIDDNYCVIDHFAGVREEVDVSPRRRLLAQCGTGSRQAGAYLGGREERDRPVRQLRENAARRLPQQPAVVQAVHLFLAPHVSGEQRSLGDVVFLKSLGNHMNTVPARADDAGRLTEAQICELVGTSQQRRQTWVSRALLRKAPASGCVLRDALGLAQLVRLVEVLGPTDGVAAWLQTRVELDQPFAAEVLDVLFDLELKEAIVVRETQHVGELVTHGRPVRLVRLGPRRAEVGAAFHRLCAAVAPTKSAEAGASAQTTRRRAKRRRA